MFYDCCILAFEERGANWRLPFLLVEKIQISRALHPSQLCPLCSVRSPLWVQTAAEQPLPLACGSNTLCCVSVIAPESVGSADSWKQSSRVVGNASTGVFPLTATEMTVCTVKACWLGLTSDYVFSGFRQNCQFSQQGTCLMTQLNPVCSLGSQTPWWAIEYLVRHLMGCLYS